MKAFFDRVESQSFQEKQEEASAMIAKAHLVITVGVGNSGYIEGYAARYFTNPDKCCRYVTDAFYPNNMVDTDFTMATVLSVSGEPITDCRQHTGF